LGDLILNLWDCGGQDAFMDSYLTAQRATIFQHVGVLIYVFDVESREMDKDLDYYRECLEGLRQFSPDAAVFLLIHKMDLVRQARQETFDAKKEELQDVSGDLNLSIFGTSIYDESLYKVHISICLSRKAMLTPNPSRLGQISCIH
jgi:Ras-related GTP-binding protein A/B